MVKSLSLTAMPSLPPQEDEVEVNKTEKKKKQKRMTKSQYYIEKNKKPEPEGMDEGMENWRKWETGCWKKMNSFPKDSDYRACNKND